MDFSTTDLIALAKALAFVRFESREYEARYLAGSPIIAELHKRVTEANAGYYRAKGMPIREWGDITAMPHYLTTIRVHITNTENWSSLSETQKSSFVSTMTFPFTASEETVAELIGFGNQVHSSNSR